MITSGVRLGTPAVTTRGMKEEDMEQIAQAIRLVLDGEEKIDQAKAIVKELTGKYPLV